MKEYPDRREDAETTPEEFSLESIMREFGGWSKREEPEKPEPAQEPEPTKKPEAAEALESLEKAKTPETAEGAEQETPAPEARPAEEKCGKEADKAPETAARIWTWKPETAEAARAVLETLDYLTFSSASGVELFYAAHGAIPERAVCVCIGEVTAQALSKRYDRPFLTAATISAQGIVDAILGHRAGGQTGAGEASGAAGRHPGGGELPTAREH